MNRRNIVRASIALIVVLLCVCLLGGLGAVGLIGPDEPRYVWIGRAMAQTADFVTPRLWGHPWFEKPALYYWSAAASFHVFGVSDWAARLPDALAALAGALILGWGALRLYGARAARLTLLLFPTSVGLFAFAHAATPDMLLAISLEAAMIAGIFLLHFDGRERPAILRDPRAASGSHVTSGTKASSTPRATKRPRRLPLILVGVCLGLGALAKGPVAVILAGGSVLLWAAVAKRWLDALRFLRWEAVAAFVVVTLPWYIACSLANPGFAYGFLWHQNVQRFLTPVFEHVQPWWFFIPVLALGLLPWTAALLAAAREGWRIFRQGDAAHSPGLYLACWAAFPLLFFSFSKSKLPGYILPAIPPLVLLLARTVDGLPDRLRQPTAPRDRLGTTAIALVGVSWIGLALAAGRLLRRLPPGWEVSHYGAIRLLLFLTAAVGGVTAAQALARFPGLAIKTSALWMGVLVATLNWMFLPQLDSYLSARQAARAGIQMAGSNATVETYGVSRDWQYGLDYYFAHALPEWSGRGDQPTWIYTTPKALPTIRATHRIEFTLPLPSGLLLVRAVPSSP